MLLQVKDKATFLNKNKIIKCIVLLICWLIYYLD